MVLLDNPSGSLGSEPEGLFFILKGLQIDSPIETIHCPFRGMPQRFI